MPARPAMDTQRGQVRLLHVSIRVHVTPPAEGPVGPSRRDARKLVQPALSSAGQQMSFSGRVTPDPADSPSATLLRERSWSEAGPSLFHSTSHVPCPPFPFHRGSQMSACVRRTWGLVTYFRFLGSSPEISSPRVCARAQDWAFLRPLGGY